MAERIHTYPEVVVSAEGVRYRVHAYGAPTDRGVWIGWLVFDPEGAGASLRTDRETTQPGREDLEYWAEGVEPVYLDGALNRALPV